MNRLINQFWRVRRRLVRHRAVGVGKRIHGRRRARAIRGIPKKKGLINWSKKLSIMVSFRILFLAFLCFEVRIHLGRHALLL